MTEAMARKIFQTAIDTNRCAELLTNLFDGGAVTWDAPTGGLIMLPPGVLDEMTDGT